ncbi:two-component system sensor histidine kinase [Arcobacter acticola]|jgi:two-component system, OmpR family, sensor kinase|uniref:histidine kinase n=1 Tax=Arcobacter acticola TaxID=1849015 RepID=A0A6M8E952_9BACT|nr:HAMP domain-containing sensor histidine kinase [Arcobacter acticola]QKE27783.1 two-component system sensor histidine kinase [Arcobacter acticola]
MESKSIYRQFYTKLIIATSLFIITLSFIFYEYARSTVYDDIQQNMLSHAKQLYKASLSTKNLEPVENDNLTINLVTNSILLNYQFQNYQRGGDYYIKLLYPFDLENKQFLQIIRNISLERELLYSVIFKNLFILAIPGFLLMLLYSLAVSKSLLKPIIQINKKLSNMDENSLTQIDKKDLPIEFHSLANSINSLTNRIETYVKFKKELFIGAAHELKTPLAVMKLKNEVTLKKKREIEKYEETLKLTIKSIDDMNIMISSILDIGRTEGAQFEQNIELDLVEYIKKKANDYRMLSAQKNIIITFFSNVNHLNTSIQLTLFNQILQNFVQNAIKFTPNEKSIAIRLKKTKDEIIITVTDEGIGINENVDLFAPFKRIGNQSGVGLGLFLAKNAADALRAKITLENRNDGKTGCIAKLVLNNTSKAID